VKMSDETLSHETLNETTSEMKSEGGSPLSTADLVRGTQQNQAMDGRKEESHETDVPLVPENEAGGLRDRWSSIQANFVDEPQSAVEEADTLVAEVIQSLAKRFADERTKLDDQWHGGGEASTEDLRQALRHYRSFFQRLLAA